MSFHGCAHKTDIAFIHINNLKNTKNYKELFGSAKGIPREMLKAYLTHVKNWCPAQPVIHFDDSNVIKPMYKFESLGWDHEGSDGIAA